MHPLSMHQLDIQAPVQQVDGRSSTESLTSLSLAVPISLSLSMALHTYTHTHGHTDTHRHDTKLTWYFAATSGPSSKKCSPGAVPFARVTEPATSPSIKAPGRATSADIRFIVDQWANRKWACSLPDLDGPMGENLI
jgi:hypothetical protein